MYIPGGPRIKAGVGAGVGVRIWETIGIRVGVPLLLVKASGASPASSLLLVRAEMKQVYDPAIWLAGLVSKIFIRLLFF